MNLFRKQKFSIRKFNIGIFSTIIGTTLFLSQTHQALAEENKLNTNSDTPNTALTGETNTNELTTVNQNNVTNTNVANTSDGTIDNQVNDNQRNANDLLGNESISETNPDLSKEQSTESSTNNFDPSTNNSTKLQLDSINNNIVLPENLVNGETQQNQPKLVTESRPKADRPKKRSRRAAVDNNAGGTVNSTTVIDPKINNTGPNAINEVLTFDDIGVTPSKSRNNPTVTIVEQLPGFNLINGGKVGVISHTLVRSGMFNSSDEKNYQAQNNVIVLGRANGADPNDHGDFNGIEKTLTVNPNSELVFDFSTMLTKNRQGAVNIVIRNADDDNIIGEKTVSTRAQSRLFKVPDNVTHLKIQFIPNNDAITDIAGVYQLKDGYKYYDFIDNVGLFSGSHIYVENRNIETKAVNNREFNVSTSLKNDGDFAASMNTNEFVYTIHLPEGIEYVDQSLTTELPFGNGSGNMLNPMITTYDPTTRTITIKSNGDETNSNNASLMPNKNLNINYKLRVNNVPTPRQVTFQDNLVYKTFAEEYFDTPPTPSDVNLEPYNIDIVMNKDELQRAVDTKVIASNYTIASVDEYNTLKARAQTILDESRNNVPINQRISQADIDQLTYQLQHTLISRVEAARAVNNKADDMTDTVNQDNELTDEEKEAAINKIEQDRDNAINNIDDQTTDDGVTNEKNAGLNILNGDTGTPIAKPNARQAVNDKATEQRALINQDTVATTEEKEAALNELNQTTNQAIGEIDNSVSNSDVDQAKDNGVNAINIINPVTIVKQNARDAVANVAQQKKDEINANTDATLEERQAAIQAVDQALTEANTNITNANTNDEVDQAKNNSINTIQSIQPETQVKTNAKNLLNLKAQEQLNIIANNNDATIEEQQAAQQILETELNQGIQNIENADTNQEVENAKDTSIQNIQSIQPATKVKSDARTAVNEKATEVINNINATPGATKEERDEAIAQVNTLLNRVINDINTSSTTPMVEALRDAAINDLGNIQPHVTKKQEAIAILNQLATDKKQDINQNINATTEEKEAAINEVDTQLADALNHIDQADTNAQVDEAQQNGTAAINNIQEQIVKKPDARNEINQHYNDKLSQINQTPDATTDEKAAAIQLLDEQKKQALEAINQAQTNNDVDQAKEQAIQNIDAVQVDVVVKPDARHSLESAKNAQQQVINATPDATVEEINTALQKLNQIFNQANNAINQAQTNQQVTDATQQSIEMIHNTLPETTVKTNARNNIENQSNKQTQLIQNSDESTVEEKNEAQELVNQAKEQSIKNIDQAHTNQEVETAYNNGIQSIQQISPSTVIKTNARQTISKAIQDKEKPVLENQEATQEEKNQFMTKMNTLLNDLNQQITKDTTNQEVANTKDNGLVSIEQSVFQPTVKQDARIKIQEFAEKQTELINHSEDATNEEKNNALEKLKATVQNIINQINTATMNSQVNLAQNNGESAISIILPKIVVKEEARTQINQAINNQDEVISKVQDATQEEKDEANNEVNRLANQAINDINNLRNNNQVEVAKDEAINKIQQILPSTAVKTNARQLLNETSQNKIKNIKETLNATTNEIEAAISEIEKILEQALSQINQDITTQQVNKTKEQGVQAINDVQVKVVKKLEANELLSQVANNQEQLINQINEATKEEKELAITKVLKELEKAKELINNALSNSEVDQVYIDAAKIIESIKPNIEVKPQANKDINQVADEVKNQIRILTNVDPNAVNNAMRKIASILEEADIRIKQAKTNDEVSQIVIETIEKLKGIKISPLKSHIKIDTVRSMTNCKNYIEKQISAPGSNLNSELPDTGLSHNHLPLAGITFTFGIWLYLRSLKLRDYKK
ncbi:methicillin resistance protein FmtB [Staphylococcus pasteuri]|uniref:SasC/FmtB family protein n=1 Tax=Staphylococcus pasteuri TaxID=45972 RepID=UPI000D344C39|nr:SasC/FmtB family protein [Staphylococcus pasteuri]PTU86791.1 methicillin resistance protein FmtB [Staphylococcus pasteuri]